MCKKRLVLNSFLITFILLSLLPLSYADTDLPPLKLTLDNGLTIILKESHSAPVVAFNMWVRVGSVDERAKEAGIAHVFEHMLFKGTKKRGVGEIAREIDEAGGYINAYTSLDMTVYHLVIASRYFDTGLDIIADALQNSSFDPQEFEKEKKVILEELKMGKDEPSTKAYEELLDTAYEKHPYKRPIIGYEETVKGLTRDDILHFYKQWYVPNNMVLVIVGDFQTDGVLPKIKSSFASFKSSHLPERDIIAEPVQKSFRSKISYDDIKEANLNFAFHIPELKHEDVPGLDLLAVILGQGESSRLYKKIKSDLNLVNSISAYSMTPKYPGLFLISASLEKEKIKEAIQAILKEIYLLKVKEVSLEELEKAKLNLESDFIYEKETVQGEARKLGYYETIADGLGFEEKYIAGVKKVTIKDIKRVAEKYFKNSNLTVTLLAPETGGKTISSDKIIAIVSNVDNEIQKIASEELVKTGEEEITKKILPNGMVLLIKEDHSIPIVAISAVFLGGTRFEPSEKSGISNFVSEMLIKGTKRRTAAEIALDMESIAGSLDSFSGRDSFGIKARLLSRYFGKGLDIIADILMNPSFEEIEFAKKKEDILLAIKNQEDELTHLAFNLFNKALYQNHPYSRDILGTKESIGNMKREDLVNFYKTFAVARNLVFAIVGDVQTQDISKKIEEAFKNLNQKEFFLPEILKPLPPGKMKIDTIYKEKKQAHIILGFLGADNHDPDRYPLEVLNNILAGQGGRLFIELRDKQGLAYSVTAMNQSRMDRGFLAAYIATSPENIEKAIAGIKNEFLKITKEKVSAEELERAKKSLIGNYEISLQRRSNLASEIAFNERYGLGFQEYKRFAEKISAVTAQDVLIAAQKYINFDHAALAIVRPEKEKLK